MSGRYTMDENGDVRPETDLIKWARSFERANRRVAQTSVGDVRVSTVFLGLDHSFGNGPPILFETMIFGGAHDQYQERYTTRDEAMVGHDKAVTLAKGGE